MSRTILIIGAAGGSAALMLGALAFQYLGGLPPCALCYWQRYPHVAAMAIGVLALVLGWRSLALLGAGAALTTAGIGAYHSGVERGWWEGPSTCSAQDISGLSTDDLLDQIMSAPMVRCTDVAWEMLGLSMASWNMLASLLLAGVWLMAWRRA